MKAVRAWVIAGMTLALCAGVLPIRAQPAPPTVSRVIVNRAAPRRAALSMAQAVRLVQRHFRARVVRAETRTQGDRTIYVLRMLDDRGRVFAVRVDAVSGAIL
jgi:uncharacterized membrane protein YkoI